MAAEKVGPVYCCVYTPLPVMYGMYTQRLSYREGASIHHCSKRRSASSATKEAVGAQMPATTPPVRPQIIFGTVSTTRP
jgi:hypothetical protein